MIWQEILIVLNLIASVIRSCGSIRTPIALATRRNFGLHPLHSLGLGGPQQLVDHPREMFLHRRTRGHRIALTQSRHDAAMLIELAEFRSEPTAVTRSWSDRWTLDACNTTGG